MGSVAVANNTLPSQRSHRHTRRQKPESMDTLSSAVWTESMGKEKKSHAKWVEKHGSQYLDEDSDDDDLESYEAMLKNRKAGLSRKIGSWADKDGDPPRTPSQDVRMIRTKMPPLQKPITGDLEGFNAHQHIPGYTGFFPGQKCKE